MTDTNELIFNGFFEIGGEGIRVAEGWGSWAKTTAALKNGRIARPMVCGSITSAADPRITPAQA